MKGLLHVDPGDPAPLWRQIEEGLRRLVASGTLGAGTPVPSVRDLAKELCINPATVAKAYQRLAEAELLTVKRGEGTFVSDRPREERGRLLGEGARRYVDLARTLGAGRGEALAQVEGAWGPEKGGAR